MVSKDFNSTGTMNERVDYPTMLLMQINRIAQASILGLEKSYIDGIDDLECFIEPSKDDEFRRDIEKINEWIASKVNKNEPRKRGIVLKSLSKEHARQKLAAIMRLISRKGLLPTDEWVFEA